MNEVVRQFLMVLVGVGIGILTAVLSLFWYYHLAVLLKAKNLSYSKIHYWRLGVCIGSLVLGSYVSSWVADVWNGVFTQLGFALGAATLFLSVKLAVPICYVMLSSLWTKWRFGVSFADTKKIDNLPNAFNRVKTDDLKLFLLWMDETHCEGIRDWAETGVFRIDFKKVLNKHETLFDGEVVRRFYRMFF